jgi:hypothetical protein
MKAVGFAGAEKFQALRSNLLQLAFKFCAYNAIKGGEPSMQTFKMQIVTAERLAVAPLIRSACFTARSAKPLNEGSYLMTRNGEDHAFAMKS